MCGIAGILSVNGEKVHEEDVKKMTDAIRHRGPDGEGRWLNPKGNLCLGHRRLSILDLSIRGAQPMHYLEKRYSLVFNGEIYNYLELKRGLKEKGYSFNSESDTEVLLALYAEMGEKCLSVIDGMFSFVIWDAKKEKLFCARDRFGEKPFFYNFSNGRFSFASEMKALFASGVQKTPELSSVYTYLVFKSLRHNNAEKTFFEGIKRLEPSHYLVIQNGKIKKQKYWDLSTEIKFHGIGEGEAIEKFRELFFESVSKRLRSDVPVGSCLSGGLDSSAIVMAVNSLKTSNQSQCTFSARFKNYHKDEGEYMKKVIENANLSPFFTWPDGNKLLDDLEKLIYHQEEPFRTASAFAQWEVMKLAKENNVTVLMDGQGADEILAGYMPYFEDYFRELLLNDKPEYYRQKKIYEKRYGKPFKTDPKFFLLTYFPNQYEKWRDVYFKFRPSWLSKEFFREYRNVKNPHKRHFNTLNEKLHYRQFNSGMNDLLRFADRNSMAFSRETRLPFLSRDLVEFCMGLPNEMKIHEGWTKYLLRKSMEKELPEEITWRKDKIGFAPPHKRWMKSEAIQNKVAQGREKLIDLSILDHKNGDKADPWEVLMTASIF